MSPEWFSCEFQPKLLWCRGFTLAARNSRHLCIVFRAEILFFISTPIFSLWFGWFVVMKPSASGVLAKTLRSVLSFRTWFLGEFRSIHRLVIVYLLLLFCIALLVTSFSFNWTFKVLHLAVLSVSQIISSYFKYDVRFCELNKLRDTVWCVCNVFSV